MEETLTVRYVGPAQRGVTIDATDERVLPGDDADVPADVARGLVSRDDFEPVGWDADDLPGGFPRHRGGGTYELSDGTTVRGKQEAIDAEAELLAGGDQEPDTDDTDDGSDPEA